MTSFLMMRVRKRAFRRTLCGMTDALTLAETEPERSHGRQPQLLPLDGSLHRLPRVSAGRLLPLGVPSGGLRGREDDGGAVDPHLGRLRQARRQATGGAPAMRCAETPASLSGLPRSPKRRLSSLLKFWELAGRGDSGLLPSAENGCL